MADKFAVEAADPETQVALYSTMWATTDSGAASGDNVPLAGDVLYWDLHATPPATVIVDEAPAGTFGGFICALTEVLQTIDIGAQNFVTTGSVNLYGLTLVGSGNITGPLSDIDTSDFSSHTGKIISNIAGVGGTKIWHIPAGGEPYIQLNGAGTMRVDTEFHARVLEILAGTFSTDKTGVRQVFTTNGLILNGAGAVFAGTEDVEVGGDITLTTGTYSQTGSLIQTASGTFTVGVALASARISNGTVSTMTLTAALALLTVNAGCVAILDAGDNLTELANAGYVRMVDDATLAGANTGVIHQYGHTRTGALTGGGSVYRNGDALPAGSRGLMGAGA